MTLPATPKQLGAAAYVGDAIKHAPRVRRPGANVPLKVAAPLPRLERYAANAREALRPRCRQLRAVAAQLEAVRDEGAVRAAAFGSRLRVRDLYPSLKTHTRDPIALKHDAIIPESTRDSIGE